MLKNGKVKASFRDPSGSLFWNDGILLRRINNSYRENYDYLTASGLYNKLVEKELLIPHQEIPNKDSDANIYKTIKPEYIEFISYPYEWCFDQLKDAALLTLKIQKTAMDCGMSLKDASAYNVQFYKGKPIFIDTLSFEKYTEGEPWQAYGQFCRHFLAPLALMSLKDIRLNQLLKLYMDGVPLDLASSILPKRTWLYFSLLSHIHLHAKSQRYFADKTLKDRSRKVSKLSLLGLMDNLESAVKRLSFRDRDFSGWSDYYDATNYTEQAFKHKKTLVSEFLDRLKPKVVWDLGANTGIFSRIAAGKNALTVSFDLDSSAVNQNYINSRKGNEQNILPLIMDLTNPSPSIGWAHSERMALAERGPADVVIALALIHHLAIGNNVPLKDIAAFLSSICENLIVEFIPKTDSQVKRLLRTREDIFSDYSRESFENSFKKYFKIVDSCSIMDSQRVLYLMAKDARDF